MNRVAAPRVSPSMVIACIALLVALGGTSVAAVSVLVPRNSVGSPQVIDSSLLRKDFRRGQIPAGATGPRGPVGPAGAAGPAGANGAPGPSSAYSASVGTGPALGRSATTIATSPSLPAGKYVVWGKARFTSTPSDAVRCDLVFAGAPLDHSQIAVPSDTGARAGVGLALNGVVTLSATGTVDFRCEKDGGTGVNVASSNIKLIAIKVGDLTP